MEKEIPINRFCGSKVVDVAGRVLSTAKSIAIDLVDLSVALSYLVPNIFPKGAVVYWADKRK